MNDENANDKDVVDKYAIICSEYNSCNVVLRTRNHTRNLKEKKSRPSPAIFWHPPVREFTKGGLVKGGLAIQT